MKLAICDKFWLNVGDCFISYNELLLSRDCYQVAHCVNFDGFKSEWTSEDGEMAYVYSRPSILEVSWRKEEEK